MCSESQTNESICSKKSRYPLVSVYTCVYNGARTIHRVFKSMQNLTYPNFEHIIVNDGSTDSTDLLIQEYIKQVPFPVKYHKKENGGKHTALNIAWSLIEGEFMISLDADDELFPHSLNYLVDTYFQIPAEIRSEYWCVHGRCVTQVGEFVGDRYPDDINNGHWRENGQRAHKYRGEKIGLQVSAYLCTYRFPEVKGVRHLPEGIIWKQINKAYGTWYTNEVVRVYYVGEGGNLTAKEKRRDQFASFAFYLKWQIIHEQEYRNNKKALVYYPLAYYISDKNYQKQNGYFEGIKKHKALLTVLRPIMFVGAFMYRMITRIK